MKTEDTLDSPGLCSRCQEGRRGHGRQALRADTKGMDGGLSPGWDNAQASGEFDRSCLGRREGGKPEGKKWRREEEGRKWKEPVQIMLG